MLIVQVSRMPDGTRKITNISEITGMEGPIITMQDLFVFERHGFDENGKVRGSFQTYRDTSEVYRKASGCGHSIAYGNVFSGAGFGTRALKMLSLCERASL